MNYKNPQEGARLMYETIEKYLQEVILARPVQKLSALEEERTHHDAFRVSRLAMGGVFVGGDDYLSRLDNFVKWQSTEESPKHVVVTGDAGKIMSWIFSFFHLRNIFHCLYDACDTSLCKGLYVRPFQGVFSSCMWFKFLNG